MQLAGLAQNAGLARLVGLALPAALVAALVGCAQPAYRFIGSTDHDLVMRLPRSWQPMDTNAALKASGIDPSTQVGWTAFYDGAAKPSVKHLLTETTDAPMLFTETLPLTEAQSAGVTGDALRGLILPGTADARTAAAKAGTFKLLSSDNVSTKTGAGEHIRYSLKIGASTEIFNGIALTNPKRTTVYLAFAHCTASCYAVHGQEINDAVTSLTLKPVHH